MLDKKKLGEGVGQIMKIKINKDTNQNLWQYSTTVFQQSRVVNPLAEMSHVNNPLNIRKSVLGLRCEVVERVESKEVRIRTRMIYCTFHVESLKY